VIFVPLAASIFSVQGTGHRSNPGQQDNGMRAGTLSSRGSRIRRYHYRDVRRESRRAKDALCRRLKITLFRKKDVVNKLLGITIVKGKPTALDFQHNAVALQRTVVVAMQINCVFIHMIWR